MQIRLRLARKGTETKAQRAKQRYLKCRSTKGAAACRTAHASWQKLRAAEQLGAARKARRKAVTKRAGAGIVSAFRTAAQKLAPKRAAPRAAQRSDSRGAPPRRTMASRPRPVAAGIAGAARAASRGDDLQFQPSSGADLQEAAVEEVLDLPEEESMVQPWMLAAAAVLGGGGLYWYFRR